MQIGPGLAADRVDVDADRIVRPGLDLITDIGHEPQRPAFQPIDAGSDEGGVLDFRKWRKSKPSDYNNAYEI